MKKNTPAKSTFTQREIEDESQVAWFYHRKLGPVWRHPRIGGVFMNSK